MASNFVDLCDLPGDISESYLPYEPTLRQRQKAYAFSNNRYVHRVKLSKDENAGEIHISAHVYRSQRKSEKPHTINISVNECTKTLTEGYCSCKAGISGECSHVLATIMTISNWILEGYKEVPSEQSCTSLPQMWDKPRGPKIRPEPVSQMVICRPINMNRKRKPLMAAFHDNRQFKVGSSDLASLRNLSGCAISYLAQDGSKDIITTHGPQYVGSGLSYHAPLMNPVKPPAQHDYPCGDLAFPTTIDINLPAIVTENVQNWSHLACSMEDSRKLELETRNQATSELWMTARKKRITASNFGKIINRKSAISQQFLKGMFQGQAFTSKPTTYGKVNESIARQMYMKKTSNHAHDIGLIVNPKLQYLGATPDGKVCSEGKSGILEIKCPFSIRDMTFHEAMNDPRHQGRCFLKLVDNKLKLDAKHEYYFQVQGQLLLTGASFCDFVAYTRNDLHIERIEPDLQTFSVLLEKLTYVYVNNVKPFLESKEVNDLSITSTGDIAGND